MERFKSGLLYVSLLQNKMTNLKHLLGILTGYFKMENLEMSNSNSNKFGKTILTGNKMSKNNSLIIVDKKDPLLNLEYLVDKKCRKFSFLDNKKEKSFYSEIYSLSKLDNANVVLVDEKESGLVKTSFYSLPETHSQDLSQLFKGESKLDYSNKRCILAKGY